jgi:hypothetical protein
MIYRITLRMPEEKYSGSKESQVDATFARFMNKPYKGEFKISYPGCNTLSLFSDQMIALGLKPPRKLVQNPRARFFFTDRGWRDIGRHLYSEARRLKLSPRIERRKNPKASEIVYGDTYQVALLV